MLEVESYPYVSLEGLQAADRLLLIDNVEDSHAYGCVIAWCRASGSEPIVARMSIVKGWP